MTDQRNTVPPFSVRVRVTDVHLRLLRNEALNVFPMMQTAVTPDHLLVAPSDADPDRRVSFTVVRGPRNGRILVREEEESGSRHRGRLVEAGNFTQAQVNASRVFYEHNRPFNNLTIYDAVGLEVTSAHAARSLEIVFRVAISVSAMMPGGIDRFIGTDDVTLEEGGTAVVAPRDLNTTGVAEFLRSHRGSSAAFDGARVVLQLSRLPEHGYVVVNGVKARAGQPFLQSDVDRGFVTYTHDHSDTTRDRFGVAVLLEGGGSMAGDVVLFNGLWNVTILPVNDQKFRLVTDSPSMTVVQGQAKALTRQILLTEDPDNAPDEIVYDVINTPLRGRLVFAENLTADAARFTQADVDRERVVYVHEGGAPEPDLDFYFRVSDGKFQPVYRHFRIHVVPLELKLVNRTAVPVQQGTRMAYISSANMGTLTNGERSYTFYNVTGGPRGGRIYMSDAPASVFGQVNVDNEEVMYMQTDMSLANDSFTCTVQGCDSIHLLIK